MCTFNVPVSDSPLSNPQRRAVKAKGRGNGKEERGTSLSFVALLSIPPRAPLDLASLV